MVKSDCYILICSPLSETRVFCRFTSYLIAHQSINHTNMQNLITAGKLTDKTGWWGGLILASVMYICNTCFKPCNSKYIVFIITRQNTPKYIPALPRPLHPWGPSPLFTHGISAATAPPTSCFRASLKNPGFATDHVLQQSTVIIVMIIISKTMFMVLSSW